MELFDSTKTRLYELLKDAQTGKLQLPDFQRGWIWDDNRIKGLLASIAKSFPIGAIMLLEAGNENVRFKTRPIESVILPDNLKPEKLILDGQQRITSLYQSIISNAVVKTKNDKGQEIFRWYFIDMLKAMDDSFDIEDAIFSVNEQKLVTEDFGRKIILDLSSPELEYQNLMYPVHLVDEFPAWRANFNKHWNYVPEKIKFWDAFEEKVLNNFTHYMLPVIILKKENTKEAVCQVFEKVNTGGVALNVFELLTATFATDDFDLRECWGNIRSELHHYRILHDIENTDFLQAITLISTYNKRIQAKNLGEKDDRLPAVTCKRKDILNLSLDDFKKYQDSICQGFVSAAKLLIENYIFTANDLPYTSQLVPLSAILAVLGNQADNIIIREKIMKWYWCGVFGELYGAANETRYALDIQQVINWTRGGDQEPKTVYESSFNPSRLNTLRTRNSAAYKGIYALLMKDGALDFMSGKRIDFTTYFAEWIDIHHIFPKKWCLDNNIPKQDFDCIVNKTPLSYRTNRIIGGDAPSKYLESIKRRLGADDQLLSKILHTHVINPDHLFTNNFYEFFSYRKDQILNRIENAMKKKIEREISMIEPETNDFDNDDEDIINGVTPDEKSEMRIDSQN
ncbi:MAG: DUF262 domain-containing protein [Alphaproteobacteria bacterium]|nr:DUF262 domain-containing protein [Alphaproteobacteria bacterium]